MATRTTKPATLESLRAELQAIEARLHSVPDEYRAAFDAGNAEAMIAAAHALKDLAIRRDCLRGAVARDALMAVDPLAPETARQAPREALAAARASAMRWL